MEKAVVDECHQDYGYEGHREGGQGLLVVLSFLHVCHPFTIPLRKTYVQS